ncbi:type II toxin-antitoxin system VapC family toxin [Candidatus Collierbacteria bacterium]|nr:type II toxin-antitoxin system VapC family toxin [Candidatus Collierbacteria bacterium]
MKTYIIDASVLISSLMGERPEIRKRFEKLFADKKARIMSIPLVKLEFANGLRFLGCIQEQATLAFEKMSGLPIAIFDIKSSHVLEAMKQAFATKTTVYDCAYHYAAILLDGIFITCDKEYYKKAKDLKHILLWD